MTNRCSRPSRALITDTKRCQLKTRTLRKPKSANERLTWNGEWDSAAFVELFICSVGHRETSRCAPCAHLFGSTMERVLQKRDVAIRTPYLIKALIIPFVRVRAVTKSNEINPTTLNINNSTEPRTHVLFVDCHIYLRTAEWRYVMYVGLMWVPFNVCSNNEGIHT